MKIDFGCKLLHDLLQVTRKSDDWKVKADMVDPADPERCSDALFQNRRSLKQRSLAIINIEFYCVADIMRICRLILRSLRLYDCSCLKVSELF